MSAINSNISASKYGYDFVVATTQGSINSVMDEYISGLNSPEVIMCYVMDDQGSPQWIDYEILKTIAKGTDPFSVPNGASTASQDVQNLSQAYFMYAFKAKIGLPPGYSPLTPGGPALPDIVVLGSNTASVTYNLMCSEFTVVEASYGPRGILSWLNQSQPSGNAWIFTSQVDLRLTSDAAYGKLTTAVQKKIKSLLKDNVPSQVYQNLPADIKDRIQRIMADNASDGDYETVITKDVQSQIKNLGGNAFSVQQLLFDLDNAGLQTVPVISGVTPGTALYTCLQTVFLGAYFTQLKTKGEPVLGYGVAQDVAPPSTLILTDLNMEVNPYMGTNGQPVTNPTQQQQDLATLCYLCASGGDRLPAASPFSWNWIEASEESSYEGVIAINRNTFAKYLESELYSVVSANCYLVNTRVWLDGTDCKFKGSFSQYQAPTIAYYPKGPQVLAFSYISSSSDQAGLNGDMGQMSLSSTFNVSVTFSGNKISIVQHLVLYLRIQRLQSSESGNIFDKTIQDTFTLSIDQNGRLNSTRTTAPVIDNSVTLSANWFINLFTGLNDLVENFENWGKQFASSHFQDVPLNFAQDFIFPGGKTFTFQSVVFSDNQDLVSHITYVQPS